MSVTGRTPPSSLRPNLLAAAFLLLGLPGAFVLACGAEADPDSRFKDLSDGSEAGAGSSGGFDPDSGIKCEGLQCQQVICAGGGTTTVSGTVTAPNGTLPLYNAVVYVPNKPLEPMKDGASCERCGDLSGEPLVAAVTDVEGKFVLKNVPAGQDIPLVVQVGKWRREVKVPMVFGCSDTKVSNTLTRLPRNQSEGHIPRIAVTTGRCDQLACLLPKLGLDASEFTASSGQGRLHVYRGAAHPTATPVPAPAPTGSLDATALWNDAANLSRYDMVLMSCECGEHDETKPDASKQGLYDYTAMGGRVFASHFHYVWGQYGALAAAASWNGDPSNPENLPGPYKVDTSFPKGDAFAQWLVNVGASATKGTMPISQPRHNVGNVVAPTQRWAYRPASGTTNYLSVNTPMGKPAEEQCGKFVFADMHLYGGDVQDPATALPNDQFPASCSTTLTPEEKALAFLFFELSSCVQDDSKPPPPPVQ